MIIALLLTFINKILYYYLNYKGEFIFISNSLYFYRKLLTKIIENRVDIIYNFI
jgi:hypothetical protein